MKKASTEVFLFFLDDPLQFLIGLITPSIIFPMLALMCVALVVGYVIGILPAYLTSKIFYPLERKTSGFSPRI